MKKIVSILLCALMLLPLSGCIGLIDLTPKPTEAHSTADPVQTVTENPWKDDPAAEEANLAFSDLDAELFWTMVCSSADNYHQYIVGDPSEYGLEPEDVGPAGWGEYSYEDHAETMDFFREVLDWLGEIDRELLTEMNKIGYDAIRRACEKELAFEDYYYYDEPLEPVNGIQTMIPLSMVCFEIRCPEDLETYLELIEDIPRFLDSIGEFEKEKAELGLFMCETALDQVIESLDNISEKGEESVLITCFEDEVTERARELGVSETEIELLKARNREAVLTGVLPAYMRLSETLENLRGKCRDLVGAAGVSDKMLEYFKLRFCYEGATGEDLAAVKKLLGKMGDDLYSDIYLAVNMGSSDILDRYDDPITFGSIEDNFDWLMGFIKEYYPELPEFALAYQDVPDDIKDDFSPAAYLVPAFDDFYNNVMLVNPAAESSGDLFTTAHESVPGHLFQYVYARNMEELSYSQQLFEPTGYAEAWTVFTEYFVARHCEEKDKWLCMLINSDDTFCNVFLPAYVSILVNADGYGIKEVTDYLKNYGMESAADVYYEYAVTMPYLASSYAVGFSYLLEIYNDSGARSAAEHRSFFERYLSFGPCDMDVIREYMRK